MTVAAPLDAHAAGVLLSLLHEAWHEMRAHRGKCARMDALAEEMWVVLAKYAPRAPAS